MHPEEIEPGRTDKLSLSFNRKFPLSRNDISSILRVFADNGNIVNDTILGEPKRQAMSQYCERAGLTSDKHPTPFGLEALYQDPTLSRLESQWIMHYFLAAPWRYTPNFWSELTSSVLLLNSSFSGLQVQEQINQFAIREVDTIFAEDTLKAAATAFLGTYARKDGLYALGIFPAKNENGIEKEQTGSYQMRQPHPIPPRAFACILADYWQEHYRDRPEVPIAELSQGLLPQLLLLSEPSFNGLLAELAAPDLALVRRQRHFTPYTITRLWDDPASLWATLYTA